ncbi:MAG: Hsp20/alpha crystallin family protein [Tistlia sp.]|uniref:Hsp20/alpha crystallin family protein n=1 Tax=Tistlia sp. TaxID=3057121 RepID=UPI0034A4D9F8
MKKDAPVSSGPAKPTTRAAEQPSAPTIWQPLESLREEIDQLFDDVGRGAWRLPFGRSLAAARPLAQPVAGWSATVPAIDVAETDDRYELTAELPGIEEKDVEVKLTNGSLLIRGEKREEKEEKRKDYHLSERRYGSFERRFRLPDGVEADKIEARFKSGVLTVMLPKTAAAKTAEKKIKVRSA